MLNVYYGLVTRFFLIGMPLFLLTGCQTTYYQTMEKLGYHKRDILASRVEKVRDAQIEAKDQFQSALEQFASVVDFEGGNLEALYKRLHNEYQTSEAKAEAVRTRIASVENVAEALFDEWEQELKQYSNSSLRRSSQQKLTQTRSHYNKLLHAMKRAEAKVDPVLASFHDQVLFLKHNLNAQAIAALQSELNTIRTDVSQLIKEMEAAINEANIFIATLES
jgi:hypothetical protein